MPWCMNCVNCCEKCAGCCPQCMEKFMGTRKSSIAEATQELSAVPDVLVENKVPLPKPKYLPLTFLPDIIVEGIMRNKFGSLPCQIHSEAVILICDVCNFTGITESYCQKGVLGIEELASILNGYMSTLAALMLASGGDILNFAGDAFLVLWNLPESKTDKLVKIALAYKCAVALQAHKSLQDKNLDGMLKVKIGMSVGEVSTWVLGSNEFMLFVVAGAGLPIAHHAESMCSAGDIIVSKEVFSVLNTVQAKTFNTTFLLHGFVRICDCEMTDDTELTPVRIEHYEHCQEDDLSVAKTFLIPSVRGVKTAAELNYLSELTLVTILFISLPDINVEDHNILAETFEIVLACAKKQEGAFNKMLLFDKGCTYLVVFGLPGQKHPNDAARALMCAHDIVDRHTAIDVNVSIGVASGTCFCGLVGHPQRQEYTVIGNRVNLAARLMVTYKNEASIVLDADTFHLSRDVLGEHAFTELPFKKMKGIQKSGKIYTCKIKRLKEKTSDSMMQLFEEDSIEQEIGDDMQNMKNCLTCLSNPELRVKALSNSLLPVIVFEGDSGYGKNYFMYSSVMMARQMGYKVVCCCAIPSIINEPFATATLLVQRILNFEREDSLADREAKILEALPHGFDPQLYLLNHLFHVQFPHPKLVNIDHGSRNSETIRIFRAIFKKFAGESYVLFAIDEADFVDENSWILGLQILDDANYVMVLNLSNEFKTPSLSASVLFLKAHTHVNVNVIAVNYFQSLACWFLGVGAISKGLVSYLKERTGSDSQLLQEVLLSPTITECTQFIPYKSLTDDILGDFYISEFLSAQDKLDGSVMACVIKPGFSLISMNIPPNINDAVQDSLNYCTVQDRLLLKRASLMGSDFDQHLLQSISPGQSPEEIIECINHLMSKNIFISVCSSPIILERLPAKYLESQAKCVECYDVCFCYRVTQGSSFQNRRSKHYKAGPYDRIRFRTNAFRMLIRSYMTTAQFQKMYMEIVNELETNGVICISCKHKRLEILTSAKNTVDMRASPILIDVEQCTCLQRRPNLYNQISSLYRLMGLKLLPAYYAKKAAQASNNIGYPIKGLFHANAAEELLPSIISDHDKEQMREEEAHFDPIALRSSIQKVKARSAMVLGNYYYAASYVQNALTVLGLDCVCFYGIFSPNKFNQELQRLPLLHSEVVTRILDIFSESYLLAEKYDLALMILKYEFVALSYYPIDFLQILNFMILLYLCYCEIKPKNKFRSLEHNLLNICHHRLWDHEVMLNVLEIRKISRAYVVLIERNIHKADLSTAKAIAEEALKVLVCTNDRTSIAVVYVHLIEIYLYGNHYSKCFTMLRRIPNILDDRDALDVSMLYHYALALVMIKKLEAEGISEDDKENIDKCNEFATTWTQDKAYIIKGRRAFYGSAVFALWSMKYLEYCHQFMPDTVFKQCFDVASTLFKQLHTTNYWNVGATLLLLRIQLSLLIKEARLEKEQLLEEQACQGSVLEQAKEADEGGPSESQTHSAHFIESLFAILEDLQKLKKRIKYHYPVYQPQYNNLRADITNLMIS